MDEEGLDFRSQYSDEEKIDFYEFLRENLKYPQRAKTLAKTVFVTHNPKYIFVIPPMYSRNGDAIPYYFDANIAIFVEYARAPSPEEELP